MPEFPASTLDYNLFNPRFFTGAAALPPTLTTATFCFPAALASTTFPLLFGFVSAAATLILLTVLFFGDSGILAVRTGVADDGGVGSTRGSVDFGNGIVDLVAVDDGPGIGASSSLSTISTNSRGGDRGAA